MSKVQVLDQKNRIIHDAFLELKRTNSERLRVPLNLSWSNWTFGVEPLVQSAARLVRNGIRYVELHGNHYAPDLGSDVRETHKILSDNGLRVSGICGMFSADNDLSSTHALSRQAAVDYLKRELDYAAELGASYILVVPGAVGRPQPYDDMEFERSVGTIRLVADRFIEHEIKGAVEPIRSAEVSFCHTVADAKGYIEAVNHSGIRHINGDVYHMQTEEAHIGEAILEAGETLINLHVADSNRCALGEGSIDLDTVIMSLYLIHHNDASRFVTAEPLGPGGDPYPAMFGKPDRQMLDRLVERTAVYFRERERSVVS